ncbi:MAG: EAL domain-containing protein [Bellilinea sp.]|jgi:diguanylate cyclase (GGDEF)-like protein/PAS domain S-box-containing protein
MTPNNPPLPPPIELLIRAIDEAVIVFEHQTRKVITYNHKVIELFNTERVDSDFIETLLFKRSASNDVVTSKSENIIRIRNYKTSGTYRHFEIRLKTLRENSTGAIGIAIIKDITQQLRWQKTQDALIRISESASSSQDLDALFVSFHQIISGLMPANNFYIALYNPLDNIISFPYYKDEFDLPPEPHPLGRGLTEYVLRRGTPLLVSPEGFEKLLAQGEVESIGAPSIDWIGVPLITHQKTIGVITVQSYTPGVRYTPEDLRFLTLVAPHVASAILIKQSEIALRKQHELVQSIFDRSPNAIIVTDLEGLYIDCNQADLEQMGAQSKSDLIGHSVFEFIHEEDLLKARKDLEKIITTGKSSNSEYRINTLDGRMLISQLSASLIFDENNLPQYIVGIITDVTQQRLSEQALKISEERYKLASEGVNDGIWDWDLLSNRVYYSPRWSKLLGFSPDELSDKPDEWLRRVHPDDLPTVKSTMEAHLSGLINHFEVEHRLLHLDGSYRWMIARGMAVRSELGNPHRIAGSLTDITRNKLNEDQLVHQALYDRLTGLPNRILFIERLDQIIKRFKRHDQITFAILLLDLDRFKIVNDSLGHHIGDFLIIEIARRLDNSLREEDTVARLGGDEFAILLTDLRDPFEVVQIANRIQREISQPVIIEQQQVFTTCSIGIALSVPDTDGPEAMMRDADTAMYEAKAKGGNSYMIFDKLMHARAVNLLNLETDLRQAMHRNELLIFFQPIFDALTQRVVNAEALVRWKHPQHGLILPNQFINLAEETGLIVPIGEWVLREACGQLKKWHNAGFKALTISVNFSARQFQQADLSSMVRDALVQSNLEPSSLYIEITESRSFFQLEKFETMLWELRGLGVKISIDDFGTGYSSLTTIQRLPVNAIKIGQDFISRLGNHNDNDLIVQSMIEMAHRLGLSVTAEGVETEAQLSHLRKYRCDMVQGFWFSEPVFATELEKLLDPKGH